MSTALYRRYRPDTFVDMIGQEQVTEPLTQALRSGRVNHAYLFSGPRGCGKTTSARILARCLNCEQGPTPQPCNVCDSCVALARGGAGTVDVIEIDAASHGGVDDARDLRERAAFGPAQSRYKVYIIDEAHMVTAHGFNALLKVVEEPPEHVKFIFATTEPDKVLSTIRSRTHHYPFRLVPPQRMTAYLETLCSAEEVAVEPGVLAFVTRAGAGSVRDSLSVLDQLISGAGQEGLTQDRTASLLGFTDTELLDAVVLAVASGDAASVFTQIDRVIESGHDPRRFVEDLLERYRDLIVLLAVGEQSRALVPGAPEDQVERMAKQAACYGAGALSRCADVVSHGLAEMTGAVSYRLLLELICARMLLPGAAGERGYAARLDRIEHRLASSEQPAQLARPARPTPKSAPPPDVPPDADLADPPRGAQAPAPLDLAEPEDPEPVVADATAQAPSIAHTSQAPVVAAPPPATGGGAGMDTEAVRRSWPQVLDTIRTIRRVTWTLVSVNTTVVDYDGTRLLLEVDTAGQTESFRRGNHAEVVRQALSEAIGIDARVEGIVKGTQGTDHEPRRLRSRAPRTRADPVSIAPVGPAESAEAPVSARSRAARGVSAIQARAAAHTPSVVTAPTSTSSERTWGEGSSAAPPWATPAASGDPSPTSSRGGDVPALDDDDLENSTTVGQPVIESVLGGRVIAVDDGSQH